jgi:hypothetical protein
MVAHSEERLPFPQSIPKMYGCIHSMILEDIHPPPGPFTLEGRLGKNPRITDRSGLSTVPYIVNLYERYFASSLPTPPRTPKIKTF